MDMGLVDYHKNVPVWVLQYISTPHTHTTIFYRHTNIHSRNVLYLRFEIFFKLSYMLNF